MPKTVITMREVQEKGYIMAHGMVYNAKEFSDKHPGGEQCILKSLGKDCTRDYDMHRKAGQKVWAMCYVGALAKEK